MRAGARSALATLWVVNDPVFPRIVADLYGELAQGRSRAAALRAAQRRLLQDPAYRHPYFWASFLMINNWI